MLLVLRVLGGMQYWRPYTASTESMSSTEDLNAASAGSMNSSRSITPQNAWSTGLPRMRVIDVVLLLYVDHMSENHKRTAAQLLFSGVALNARHTRTTPTAPTTIRILYG